MVLAPMGLVAGLTTTVAGAGGGVLLMVTLAVLFGDPVRALAVATPALLVGNVHRWFLYRREFASDIGVPYTLWALLGALMGGFAVVALPPVAISLAMLVAALAAVANQVIGARFSVPPRFVGPAGWVVGVASTTGGAGMLSSPVLQAAGLRGGAYLAVLSVSAVAMHVGRGTALGLAGAIDLSVLRDAAWLAATIPIGNALGSKVRVALGDRSLGALEVATSTLLVGLSVAGLVR